MAEPVTAAEPEAGIVEVTGSDVAVAAEPGPEPAPEPEPEPVAIEGAPPEPSGNPDESSAFETVAAAESSAVEPPLADSGDAVDDVALAAETPAEALIEAVTEALAEETVAGSEAGTDPVLSAVLEAPVEASPDVLAQPEGFSGQAGDSDPALASFEAGSEPVSDDASAPAESSAEVAPAGAAAAPAGAAPYAVDESVLAILREEAEREANARRAEAQAIETQTDLGLAVGSKKKKAQPKQAARRDLLPDVEEINSTLRPSEPEADADGAGSAAAMATPVRSGFRSGFLAIMTVAILAAALYIVAPRLGAMMPALSDPLQAYVGFIDGLRLHLDGMMRSATVALNGG